MEQPVARSHRPREHPYVGDLLAGRGAFDLEDGTRDGTLGVTHGGRQELRDAGHQRLDACSGDRRPEEDGVHERALRLRGKRLVEPKERDARLVIVDVRGQNPLVPLGEHFGQPRLNSGFCVPRREARVSCSEPMRGPDRDDRRCQPLRDRPQDAFVTRSGTVDLVHEDQRRNVQPLQGPHQKGRLRLHAFDGGDHEHGAVEHAQHPFHLGDEVRVARRVDQVDGDVVDRERHDGGADRDAALLFQRHGVGLGRARIDAADLVDDTGCVEQPLGESCLTGVYMRQDPQVQRFPYQGSYPPNRLKSPVRLT